MSRVVILLYFLITAYAIQIDYLAHKQYIVDASRELYNGTYIHAAFSEGYGFVVFNV